MAVTQYGFTEEGNIKKFIGLSTDTKPTECENGSTFWELDTKTGYIYSCKNINPATSNGWWPV
jgi:hypothetical protein